VPDAGFSTALVRHIAIVHDKFTVYGGAEKCVEQMHALWPDAPIFTSVCDPETIGPVLAGADIRPSRLTQRLYRGGDRYAHLLPLLPRAFASHDLGDFDTVVTSHHAFANRIRPKATATMIAYTHTPARWIWDPAMRAHEIGGRPGRIALGAFAATQRGPDRRAAQRPNRLAANSSAVVDRIQRWWQRDAEVIAPPVDTDFFTPDDSQREDFFLLAGRLVPYKRPDIAIAAATAAGVRLVVAGDGRARARCEAAAGPTVEFVGYVDRATQRDLFRRCRALVFPGTEDFGIIVVEAQACGAPVIAIDRGGARDSVLHDVTGVRYEPSGDPVAHLARILRDFSPEVFDPTRIRAHAEHFGIDRFRSQLQTFVGNGLDADRR
jgi:glycosyltransferase involved in cell wall biosynthesis